MGAQKPGMQDVILVELGTSEEPGGPPTGARAGARRDHRWGRLVAREWKYVAVFLVLVIATTSIVTALRHHVRLGMLAKLPAVVAPLDGAVHVLWHSSGAQYSNVAVDAGTLFAVENHTDGSIDLVARDPQTGSTAWSAVLRATGALGTDGNGASCALPDGQAPPATEKVRRAIACVVTDETGTSSEEAGGSTTYPTKARLVVVDRTSGAILSDDTADPSTVLASVGPDDLMIGTILPDGRVQLRRAASSGTPVRWVFTSPEPAAGADSGHLSLWIGAAGDIISARTYGSTTFSAWELTADGREFQPRTTDSPARFDGLVDVLSDGKVVTETPADTNGGSATTTVTDVETGHTFVADAYPVSSSPDDGSLAGRLVMRATGGLGLTCYDVASGAALWTVADANLLNGGQTMVLDGRVIVAGSTSLRSIDGRTGRVLWSTTTPTRSANGQTAYQMSPNVVTDGSVILVSQPDASGGAMLSAYGLEDGALQWTSTLAEDVILIPLGGRLFGWSGQGFVALG